MIDRLKSMGKSNREMCETYYKEGQNRNSGETCNKLSEDIIYPYPSTEPGFRGPYYKKSGRPPTTF